MPLENLLEQAVSRSLRYGWPFALMIMDLNSFKRLNDRQGHVTVGHDFEVGWRATKLERNLGEAVRGRFLHVENVQPRREDPSGPPRNDRIGPEPGFTAAQYRTLALLYVLASVRAGTWLIPAFHANIDRGIPNAHDDPQHFDLGVFDRELARWVGRLGPKNR